MHLEKFRLNFSSSSFIIRVNLFHPLSSLFLYGLLVSLEVILWMAKIIQKRWLSSFIIKFLLLFQSWIITAFLSWIWNWILQIKMFQLSVYLLLLLFKTEKACWSFDCSLLLATWRWYSLHPSCTGNKPIHSIKFISAIEDLVLTIMRFVSPLLFFLT